MAQLIAKLRSSVAEHDKKWIEILESRNRK